MADNIEEIKNSLKVLPKVFHGLEDYRVIGSILVAAIAAFGIVEILLSSGS